MEPYSLCRCRKYGLRHTAWIKMDLANKGSYVKLRIDGEWDDGWLVEEILTNQPSSFKQETPDDTAPNS